MRERPGAPPPGVEAARDERLGIANEGCELACGGVGLEATPARL